MWVTVTQVQVRNLKLSGMKSGPGLPVPVKGPACGERKAAAPAISLSWPAGYPIPSQVHNLNLNVNGTGMAV